MSKRNNNRGSDKQGQTRSNTQSNSSNNSSTAKKYNCSTHGANNTHDTKDCKVSNQAGAQVKTCDQCGKKGHLKKDCWSNTNNQKPTTDNKNNAGSKNKSNSSQTASQNNNAWSWTPMDLDTTEPVKEATPVTYCGYCNTLGHVARYCANNAAILAYHTSCMRCMKCNLKGHLRSDCENPHVRKCNKCQATGHTESNCKSNASADPRDVFRAAIAESSGAPYFGGAEALEMRRQWEHYQSQAAAAGVVIDEKFRFETERAICVKAAEEMCCLTATGNSQDKFKVRHLVSRPLQSVAVAQIQPTQAASTSIKSLSTFSANFTFDRNQLNQMKAAGFGMDEIKAYEIFLQQKAEEAQSQHQIALRKKIDASKTYPKSCVTTAIRTQENWILENQLLTRRRMDEIKMELAKGTNFWRDPGAIGALIERQLPRCDGCRRNGVVFDRHFTPINPVISEDEILNLEDVANWGLFVGLPCYCSGQRGYTWMNIPQAELVQLEEQEKAKQPIKCTQCKAGHH